MKNPFKLRLKTLSRIAAGILFVFLIFFNIQIVLEDNDKEGINLFGLKLTSFVSDIFATYPGEEYYPGGGGGGGYPYGMVAKRFDIWYCYSIDYKTVTIAGLPTTIYCIKEYLQGVTTRVCEQVPDGNNMCAPGYWEWDPNPPCGSNYQYPPSGLAWC